jgi:hypothetical protein
MLLLHEEKEYLPRIVIKVVNPARTPNFSLMFFKVLDKASSKCLSLSKLFLSKSINKKSGLYLGTSLKSVRHEYALILQSIKFEAINASMISCLELTVN